MELRDKLELSHKEFARKLKRAEEQTATLKAKDQWHAAELALKAKELQDCEAIRTSELERRKDLDANCSKLFSQLSAVEQQLVATQEKLLEMELTIQQSEQRTDVALCARVDQCLRGYVE